jgi:hypothetical protein
VSTTQHIRYAHISRNVLNNTEFPRKCIPEDTLSVSANCQHPLYVSCDRMVRFSVNRTYTPVLIAGPLRELPARLRPVSRLVRQPELTARSDTPYLLSDDIFVRPPPYLMRNGACPVSCLVTLCVRVCLCVCVFLTAIWVCEKTQEENKQERKVQLACNESRRTQDTVCSAAITLNVLSTVLGPDRGVAVVCHFLTGSKPAFFFSFQLDNYYSNPISAVCNPEV